jgi:hypothetical protein
VDSKGRLLRHPPAPVLVYLIFATQQRATERKEAGDSAAAATSTHTNTSIPMAAVCRTATRGARALHFWTLFYRNLRETPPLAKKACWGRLAVSLQNWLLFLLVVVFLLQVLFKSFFFFSFFTRSDCALCRSAWDLINVSKSNQMVPD